MSNYSGPIVYPALAISTLYLGQVGERLCKLISMRDRHKEKWPTLMSWSSEL